MTSVSPGLAAAALALVAACQQLSPARLTADRFMQLYYANADVAEAATLCTGAAREKLENELRAIQGVAPDTDANRPTVTYSLQSSAEPGPERAQFVFKVVPHTDDVGSLSATLGLVHQDGRWLLSTLSEQHAAPEARRSAPEMAAVARDPARARGRQINVLTNGSESY
jgi:hypothetical protein